MSRKEEIARILEKVRKIWEKYPDQRMMQLLTNYTRVGSYVNGAYGPVRDPFHIQDEDLERDIDSIISREKIK
jgi:hypothetical protein